MVLLSLNNCQNRWLHIYIKPQDKTLQDLPSSIIEKFHDPLKLGILRVYVLAAQYSKSFALFLKVTFIKEQQGKQSMYFLVSTMHIVTVKQHLSVSEGCKRPVGSAQQGLPLDWLPMNLGDWVRLTSLSLRAIWRRECVNVWDQAAGTFTSSLFSMLYLARHKRGGKLFLLISRALWYF